MIIPEPEKKKVQVQDPKVLKKIEYLRNRKREVQGRLAEINHELAVLQQ